MDGCLDGFHTELYPVWLYSIQDYYDEHFSDVSEYLNFDFQFFYLKSFNLFEYLRQWNK